MKSALTLIASAAIGGLFALPAFAAGDGGSSTPTCPAGQVYSQQKQMCVDAGAGSTTSR